MDLYYRNTTWLCLQRDAFDRLARFKARRALPTWEQAIEALLAEEAVAP
jgi:predicted alpha-1,6-mannanase (GH76 family)